MHEIYSVHCVPAFLFALFFTGTMVKFDENTVGAGHCNKKGINFQLHPYVLKTLALFNSFCKLSEPRAVTIIVKLYECKASLTSNSMTKKISRAESCHESFWIEAVRLYGSTHLIPSSRASLYIQ